MERNPSEKIEATIKLLTSTIENCNKAQKKFKEGTSQHSLLRNRIKSLTISKAILEKASHAREYTLEELEKALPPILSILHKTTTAQSKHKPDSNQFKRYQPMIQAMTMAKVHLEQEMKRRHEDQETGL